MMRKISIVLMLLCGILACTKVENEPVDHKVGKKKFEKVSSDHSNVGFVNEVEENVNFNFLNYPYIYNGGGVAVGDINNDGLRDLYFTANQTSNKLYLNQGDFEFKDITESAEVGDTTEGWTTGVSMVDINGDGYLDIYVCKSGLFNAKELRENKLFVNNQDNTFTEQSRKYGLADPGFSTQAYFFDFDKDGDLDMYLVNHRPDFQNNAIINLKFQKRIFYDGSDHLYRNDGGSFVDISEEAGILNKTWGLSASIGDFNNDGWPDIYVANDFLEPDFMYINNQDNTFTDRLQEKVNHISSNSMGSDFADINNDLFPDLLVLDMSPEDHIRSKSNMPSMSTENFNTIVKAGYYYQYMINTLQLNNGNNSYSEIAQMAGLAKTDWSWAPLIADFDNDGLKDVFVTNGILHELNNQDFRTRLKDRIARKEKSNLPDLLEMMPSEKLQNYMFKNKGDLTFKNKAGDWGIDDLTYSNGAAYADLDNDGDLDIVVNNLGDKAGIYKNQSDGNYIQFSLKGGKQNEFAIGSRVVVKSNEQDQIQEIYPNRGYQSSVDPILTFGLGEDTAVDSILITWPDGLTTILTDQKADQLIELAYSNCEKIELRESKKTEKLIPVSIEEIGINFRHWENYFDDYKNQILLPYSLSKNGPFIDVSDVNNDGLDDFFIGGASGQAGALYFQKASGKFEQQQGNAFEIDKNYEDLGVLFMDADNDGDQDLYVVSGGTEFMANSVAYQDRLYINNGMGQFKRSVESLPEMNVSGQIVVSNDIDGDGDLDLFVGGRVIPDKYPYSPRSALLINEKGVFVDKTNEYAASFLDMGLITDAVFSDYDQDGDMDLMAVGEWTKIQIFQNDKGRFEKVNSPDLAKTSGLWFSLDQYDIDQDGDMDYFAGNLGLNSKFKTKPDKPFQVYCDDFDNNGVYDIVFAKDYKGGLVPLRGKECSSQQVPSLNQKFETFNEFANAKLIDIYGEKNLSEALHLTVDMLYSVYIENKGNGEFEVVKLPNELQISSIFGFEFLDIMDDGKVEILSVGNMYNTEVETVRNDASYGGVMTYEEGKFKVLSSRLTGFSHRGDAKNIKILSHKNKEDLIFVLNNNEQLKAYTRR